MPVKNFMNKTKNDYSTVPEQQESSINTPMTKTQQYFSEISQKAEETVNERNENINRYGISLPDDVYASFAPAIQQAEDPDEEAHKIGMAYKYSQAYGISLTDAYNQVDDFNAALWDDGKTRNNRQWFKAVSDYVRIGNNNVKAGQLGNELIKAELTGDTKTVDILFKQIEVLNKDNEVSADSVPRNWAVEALKAGAQSLPYSGYSAAAGMFGNFLVPGAGTAAAFTASSYLMRGQEYIDMRNQGIRPEIARNVSLVSGSIQGLVEASLGEVAGMAGGVAANLGKNTVGNAIRDTVVEKAASSLAKRFHFSPGKKLLAAWGTRYVMNLAEEGSEEVIQQAVSDVSKNIAIAQENEARETELKEALDRVREDLTPSLEEQIRAQYPALDTMKVNEIVKDSMDQFIGGVAGAVVLGIAPTAIRAPVDIKNYLAVKDASQTIESEEAFKKYAKEDPQAKSVFENIAEDQRDSIISEIWKDGQNAVDLQKKEDIKESKDLGDNAESSPVDESGERTEKASEYRDEGGELYTEYDTSYGESKDGKTTGRYMFGDPSRAHSLEENGNRYGYIDYTVKGDTLTIDNFRVTPGRENLSKEFFAKFAEDNAGMDIKWSPKFDTNLSLRQELIAENPRGASQGLNYFASGEDVSENKTYIKLARQLKENAPNLTNEQVAAEIGIIRAASRAQGLSTEDFVNNTFENGQLVTNKATQGVIEGEKALNQGKKDGERVSVLGATELQRSGKAILYVAKNGDFNTLVHETGHILENYLTDEEKKTVLSQFGGDKNGNWDVSTSEKFADALVDYLRTGTTENKGMENIFKKAAQFIADIFRGFQGKVELSPQIKEVFDSLLQDDGSGFSRAMFAVNEDTKRAQGKENYNKRVAEEKNSFETAVNKEVTTETAETVEEVKQAAEKVINEIDSSTDEKSHEVVNESTVINSESEAPYDLFQIISEKSLPIIRKEAINKQLTSDLEKAKAMYANQQWQFKDKSDLMRRIKRATGWEIFNNKWVHEFDERAYSIDTKFINGLLSLTPEQLQYAQSQGMFENKSALSDIIPNAELYEYFPGLKNVSVQFINNASYKWRGATDGRGITFNLANIKNAEGVLGFRGVLTHEVQHIIQGLEGDSPFHRQALVGKAVAYDTGSFDDKVNEVASEYEARYIQRRVEEINRDILLTDKTENNKTLFQVIGEKGALELDRVNEVTTLHDNLNIAQNMEKFGSDALTIRLATGWEKGVDGKWKYEIDDNSFVVDTEDNAADWKAEHPRYGELHNKLNKMYMFAGAEDYDGSYDLTQDEINEYDKLTDELNDLVNWRQNNKEDPANVLRLKNVLHAPELYAAYPELKNIKVNYDYEKGLFTSTLGAFNLESKEITLNLAEDNKEFKSVLLHEIQHAIQQIEGFATGGNTEQFNSIEKNKVTEIQKRLAGYAGYSKEYFNDFTAEKARQELLDAGIPESELSQYLTDIEGLGTIEEIIERDIRDHGVDWTYNNIQEAKEAVEKEGLINYKGKTYSNAYEAYRSLAGEVEARNVQSRIGMSAEERLNTLLSQSADIDPEQQIILFQTVQAMAEAEKGLEAEYVVFIPNQIKSATDNNGGFSTVNNNIYFQAIDLTEEVTQSINGEINETSIKNYIDSLIGQTIDTQTEPLKIKITGGKHRRHIINSNKKQSITQKPRHDAALATLELIINNSYQAGPIEEPDLSHNTNPQTLYKKSKVKEVLKFYSPITIKGKDYYVVLTTQRLKEGNPDIVLLYNVDIKKGAIPYVPNNLGTLTRSSLSKSMPQIIDEGNTNNNTLFQAAKSKVDDPLTLAGIHSLSEAKLLHTVKMGGLANPSLAVIDTHTQQFNNFGNITLVAPKTLIAKATGNNAGTFGADVYSPRYPSIIRELTSKGRTDLKDIFKSIEDEDVKAQLIDRTVQNFEKSRTPDFEYTMLPMAYLAEKGNKGFWKYEKPRFSEEVRERIKALKNDDANDLETAKEVKEVYEKYLLGSIKEQIKENEKLINDDTVISGIKKMAQVNIDKLNMRLALSEETLKDDTDPKTGLLYFGPAEKFISDVKRDIENSEKINIFNSEVEARNIVKNDVEFKKWAKEKYESIEAEEKLFNGFTPSGNRKYLPHTLENVSKLMKKEDVRGGESWSYGMGSTRALVTPKWSTLPDIRKNKDRLVNKDEFDKSKEALEEKYDEYIDIIGEGDSSTGEARLNEAIVKRNPAQYIEAEYGVKVDSEELNNFVKELKALPTEYFETKFTRPVYLNEFYGAVVPEETSDEAIKALEDAGLKILKYKDDNEKKDLIEKMGIDSNGQVLFQTDQELISDALQFESWEDFRDSYQTYFGPELDDPTFHDKVPANADDAWYKNTWEKAHSIQEKNTYNDEYIDEVRGSAEETETLKDKQWFDMMSEDDSRLDNFLRAIAQETLSWEEFAPQDQEELDMLNRREALKSRAAKELRHGFWATSSLAARQTKDGEVVQISPKARKTLMTLMSKSKRDYRDLYADFMMDDEWKVEEGYSTSDKLRARLQSPDEQFENKTPELRRAIADRLDFEDLKEDLKDGSIQMELETVQKLADGYETEIKTLNDRIEALKKQNETDQIINLKKEAQLEKLNEKLKEKQKQREYLNNIRDIKIRLIKAVNRKVDFKNIDYEAGRKIIAIQALFQPKLIKFVNQFLNSEGEYIRDAYSRYRTDFQYRSKLQNIAQASGSINARKVIKIFETKAFDKWSEDEMQLVAATLPRTDWIDELNLEEIAKKREGSLQLEFQSKEVQELLKEILPENLYTKLSATDVKNWTLEDMEDLVNVVNDIRKAGQMELRAKEELRLTRANEYRRKIERALKSKGIVINDDDTPEEKERKQKIIDKFKEKELPKILGVSSSIKGTLAHSNEKRQSKLSRLLHGYSDANIRRVARILDNGKDGINTTMLYLREDECFNAEQRAITERTNNIAQAMKDNNIELEELFKKVTVNFADGSQEFTVDELMYFYAALEDDQSAQAVTYGNMYDETVKSQYREAGDVEGYKNIAEARMYKVKRAAENLFNDSPKFKAFMEAIEKDYGSQYERMNKVSIAEFNSPVWRVEHYVPLNRLESSGDTNANRVKQDLLGMSGAPGSNYVDKGMTKKRIKISPVNQKPVMTGLYTTWADSLNRTEHFLAYAGYVRELNRVYKNRDSGRLRQYMENRYGKAMTEYIDDYINEVANPESSSAQTDLDRFAHILRGKTAPAYLAWKMSGVIKQLCTSPWPFLQYISPMEYAAACFDIIKSGGKMEEAIKSKSAFMNSRKFDPIADLIDEQKSKASNPLTYALNSFEALGMQGLEWADWSCVAPGWLAAYRKEHARLSSNEEQEKLVAAKRKELSHYSDVETDEWIEDHAQAARLTEADIETLAVRYADDITRMTQPSNRITDLSPMFKQRGPGSEISRIFLQFTTSLNVIWQNIRYDLPQAVRNKQAKMIVGMVAGYMMAGVMMGLVTEGDGTDDDDSEEEKREKRARQLAYYSMTQFTDSVPLIGSIVSSGVKQAVTKEKNYSQGFSDMFPLVTKTTTGIAQVQKGDYDKAFDNFMQAAGLSLGLPVSGVKELKALTGVGDGDGEINLYPQALIGRRPEKK